MDAALAFAMFAEESACFRLEDYRTEMSDSNDCRAEAKV
jgi:hypothetical protein